MENEGSGRGRERARGCKLTLSVLAARGEEEVLDFVDLLRLQEEGMREG